MKKKLLAGTCIHKEDIWVENIRNYVIYYDNNLPYSPTEQFYSASITKLDNIVRLLRHVCKAIGVRI
jgi:hypothetical protein